MHPWSHCRLDVGEAVGDVSAGITDSPAFTGPIPITSLVAGPIAGAVAAPVAARVAELSAPVGDVGA